MAVLLWKKQTNKQAKKKKLPVLPIWNTIEENRFSVLSSVSYFFVIEFTLATGSYVLYAGVTQILYYEKSSTRVFSINGGWNTPLHGDPSQIPKVHTTGNNGASVLVPGFIAGVVDAAQKFAKFPLETLFEPALFFSENGFKMSAKLANSRGRSTHDIMVVRFSCPETTEVELN